MDLKTTGIRSGPRRAARLSSRLAAGHLRDHPFGDGEPPWSGVPHASRQPQDLLALAAGLGVGTDRPRFEQALDATPYGAEVDSKAGPGQGPVAYSVPVPEQPVD